MKARKKYPALFDAELFFKLPVEESWASQLNQVYTMDQPVGFLDKEGRAWCGVIGGDGVLRRQRL